MRRVMVVGQPGSGKSTFARAMSARTGLPVVHLDQLIWGPGWVERSKAERVRRCHEAEARERWIFEGNYSITWPERTARADLLVWLDRPLPLRLRRVARRTLGSLGRTRPDMAEGCPERLNGETWEFVRFIWRTRHSDREAMARLAAAAPCPVARLRTDAEVAGFLAGLPATGGGQPAAPAPAP